MNSGNKDYLEGITVLFFVPLEEPVKNFWAISIMRNPIGALPKKHGTRSTGALRARLWTSFRHLPKGFTLERYINLNGHLNIYIGKGRVSFIRKVKSQGKVGSMVTLISSKRT